MKIRNKYLKVAMVVWTPCLAVVIGFCLLVVRPQMTLARQLQVRLDEAKSEYDMAQAAAKKEDQTRMSQTVGTLRSQVGDFAVEMEMAPDLVLEIAKLASDTGVDSFAMRPRGRQGLDAVPDCRFIGEKRIDLSFTSRFQRFATLLNTLERHQPVLFVESFSINRSAYDSAEPQVNMELAVLVEKPSGI